MEIAMDKRALRARLLLLHEQLSSRLQRLDRHLHHRTEPLPADSEERAQELENRAVLEGLDDNAATELVDVEHALARMERGDYGQCERCHHPIGEARLEILPQAALCMHCATH
jgi:RNA polymerase-binding protein DksA